jgi:DNA mismatch repair protein MutS2
MRARGWRLPPKLLNSLGWEKFPPFGGVSDVSESLQRAAIGSILDAEPLLKICRAAEGMRRLRETIRGVDEELKSQFPLLLELVNEIVPRPDIEKAIGDSIDDQAEIKDDASLELLRARRGIRQAQSQIQTRLRAMIGDSRLQGHLQDAFVTVRDGRYCIPVKAESRAAVPGIVHDRSGSGNALFIEPQAVVELNNRLRELAGEEKAAITDILRALSGLVGGAADDLSRSLEAAGDLDFAFAKAQLSLQMDALEPELRDNASGWNLIRARHPLVEGCVPNDIRLGRRFRRHRAR